MSDNVRLTGLPRARQLVALADDAPLVPANVDAIEARANLARTIATVSLAESARLKALVSVLRFDSSGLVDEKLLTPAERLTVENAVRALVGLPPEKD